MQNEIELKIMLIKENVPLVQTWLNQLPYRESRQVTLTNTYFDTSEQWFAKQKMGLRVRSYDQYHELTLKMKGEIIGGLHRRPEYNLALPTPAPDFKRLVSHFNLAIAQVDSIAEQLIATFSTDFQRQTWLLTFQESEIEIALDLGMIKNPYGEEEICELEFELKQGKIADLFDFIEQFPLKDGMWLSSLSKAQRGYLVGRGDKIAKEIEKLTACCWMTLSDAETYRFTQQVADFLRLQPSSSQLATLFSQLNADLTDDIQKALVSKSYLMQNLSRLKMLV